MTSLPDPLSVPVVSDTLQRTPIILADCGAAGGIDPLFNRLSDWNVVKCYGFEPNPAEFAKLAPRKSTTYYPFAISNKVGPAEFYASATFGALHDRSDVIDATFERLNVSVETIDHMVEAQRIEPPNIIKTDIEGHDYFALLGAGKSLKSVLCVKSEIGWSDENGFSAIHALMIGRGFLAFGVSYNQSVFGPLQSGDVLYLRSIDHVLLGENAKELFIKLLVIAASLRQFEYAAVCVSKAANNSLVSPQEKDALLSLFTGSVYLPEHFPVSAVGTKIALLLNTLAGLCAGYLHRSKSLPKSNQFKRPSFLFRNWKKGRTRLSKKIESASSVPDRAL